MSFSTPSAPSIAEQRFNALFETTGFVNTAFHPSQQNALELQESCPGGPRPVALETASTRLKCEKNRAAQK